MAAAAVAVSAAVVLTEAQGILLLLPSSVEAGTDGDVMRLLEARGLKADVNLIEVEDRSNFRIILVKNFPEEVIKCKNLINFRIISLSAERKK